MAVVARCIGPIVALPYRDDEASFARSLPQWVFAMPAEWGSDASCLYDTLSLRALRGMPIGGVSSREPVSVGGTTPFWGSQTRGAAVSPFGGVGRR